MALNVIFFLGSALGGLYGGLILDKYGYQALNISMTVLSFICGILYYPLQRNIGNCYSKRESNREYPVDQNGMALLVPHDNE